MIYEDDKILTTEEYEILAKKYYNSLNKSKFSFVDLKQNDEMIDNVLKDFAIVNQLLFRIGGFLNTSKIYSLTNKQIKSFKSLYNKELSFQKINYTNKTETFLLYIGYESQLIYDLILFAKNNDNEDILMRIVNDRLIALKNIFKK